MSCYLGLCSIRPVTFLALFFILLFSSTAIASELPTIKDVGSHQITGGPINGSAKVSRDSTIIMGPWGSGATYNGQFEIPGGANGYADWHGWTSKDNTEPARGPWHADTYNAEFLNGHGPGNLAAWCGGLVYDACPGDDVVGGYGNNIGETLYWEAVVADPLQPSVVTIDAWLNYNVEDGYDYVYIGCLVAGSMAQSVMVELTGIGENIHLQETFTYQPGDYIGELENMVCLEILVKTDDAYSDEDCFYGSNGAIQIDDIAMNVDNGNISYFEDFEFGTLGLWKTGLLTSVGDFASIRSRLADIDYCNGNYSHQVTFIDDGIVVPGTGGSLCVTWCYGPYGYVINTTGGLAGDDFHLNNSVLSPVMSWPEGGSTGALFEYDVYQHEELSSDSPGIFTYWDVRSTSSINPADIEDADWVSRNYFYRGLGYSRASLDLSGYLVSDARFVQVRLSVREYGYIGGWFGNDATPAPYFDNVRMVAYDLGGPSMETYEDYLANDGFPACGILDALNPGNNSVRFDMAKSVGSDALGAVDPGDSLVIEVASLRANAELDGPPVMHYRVKPNAFFDAYRNTGLPLVGTVTGQNVVLFGGAISETRFSFDLPDTGFCFPGDVMHYYFTAVDAIYGSQIETSILPADTLGFSNFDNAMDYNQSFVFHALPTVTGMEEGQVETVPVLFWDDTGRDSVRPQWHLALTYALGDLGSTYDVYYTNDPSGGLDNSLGQRATAAQLDGYKCIVYASADQWHPNIGEANTLVAIDDWLRLGSKNMFVAGDEIVSSLTYSGSEGEAFLSQWLGVSHVNENIRPYIAGQTTPLVEIIPGGPIYIGAESWIAYGGCPGVNSFDAVEVINGGVRLAEFTQPGYTPGIYPYSAMTLKEVPEFDSWVISLPYDLGYVWDNPNAAKALASLPARAEILKTALTGIWPPWVITPAPDVETFSTNFYPNPFNPKTRIDFNMPKNGQLKIRIFNIRGEQVRVLVDEVKAKGPGWVMWDGTNGAGSPVSAGVYFYEAKTGDNVEVGKMALVK